VVRGLGFPRINEVDAAVFEVFCVAGSEGGLMRPADRGDHAIQLRRRTSDRLACNENLAVEAGGLFIKRQDSFGEIFAEKFLDGVGQKAASLAFSEQLNAIKQLSLSHGSYVYLPNVLKVNHCKTREEAGVPITSEITFVSRTIIHQKWAARGRAPLEATPA
jgi:hypothetical protein